MRNRSSNEPSALIVNWRVPSSWILRSVVRWVSTDYTALYPRRWYSSKSPLWKPQIPLIVNCSEDTINNNNNNNNNNHNNNSILYSFTRWAQQPMANYRVSTNTTAIRQYGTKQRENNKINNKTKTNELAKAFHTQTRLTKNICRFTNCICSRNTSRWRSVAEGATERGKVTHVPSRNTNADCFQGRRAILSVTKEIYWKQCIDVTTPDMQDLKI
jgi:hypothetical protein